MSLATERVDLAPEVSVYAGMMTSSGREHPVLTISMDRSGGQEHLLLHATAAMRLVRSLLSGIRQATGPSNLSVAAKKMLDTLDEETTN